MPTVPMPVSRSSTRRRWVAVVVSVVVGLGSSSAMGSFVGTAQVANNTFSVAAVASDSTAPAVARTTVARVAPGVPVASVAAGRFRQRAQYRVYARADDAVGVASVTASVGAIGGGGASVPMSAGSYSVGGVSYNYASDPLTAADVPATGVTKTYTVRAVDAAGNQSPTPAQNAVVETYAQAVAVTPGVVGHWPLGSVSPGTSGTPQANDAFTAASTKNLTAHTAGGITWSPIQGNNSDARIYVASGTSVVGAGGSGFAGYVGSTVPTSADYTVEADFIMKSQRTGDRVYLLGRYDAATNSYYEAFRDQSDGSWNIGKCVNGTNCDFVAFSGPQPMTINQKYRVVFELRGSQLRLLVDGNLVAEGVDTTITAPGRAGVGFASPSAASATTGLLLDDYRLSTNGAAPTTASVTGVAPAGVVTGGAVTDQAGAIADDNGTAIGLDGTNDSVRVPRSAGNGYVVKDDFTLEAWFRASSGTGTGRWYNTKGLVDATEPVKEGTVTDFGMGLAGDGRLIGGLAGNGTTYSDWQVTSGASPVYDGATGWHHVVLTRSTSSGGELRLYVDGVQRGGPVTGSTAPMTSSNVLSFGANAQSFLRTNFRESFLAGAMDEVAVYSTALTASQVADHYAVGKGTG